MKKPTVVSIYSGAGGLDIGFKESGFEIILSTDNWPTACETLRSNYPKQRVICDDIRNIKFKKTLKKQADVLIGGPPCPAFSKSRFYRKEKKRGLEDENGFTISEFFRVLKEISPKVFLF